MSTDLEQARDHARTMAGAQHTPDCWANDRTLGPISGTASVRRCGLKEPHDAHQWTRWTWCPGVCGGCMSEAERAAWAKQADEYDAYLESQDEEDALW